jgi:hypothetical protein
MKTADGATSGTQIEFRIHPISNLLKWSEPIEKILRQDDEGSWLLW